LNKKNGLFTGRGMLWALTIPIMKNTIFLGYGADTFPLLFPNYDYISKHKTRLFGYCAASHSLYTQLGLEFGIIALTIFIIAALIYLIESLILLLKIDFTSYIHFISLGCFFSIFSFLLTSVFYSSMLSSSPPFWILMGIGIASNYKIKNNIS